MSQSNEYERVAIEIWAADAIVLYDWLSTVDLNAVPITHRAQKQALMDLLERLDTDTLARSATADEITTAQENVAKDMGW